MKLHHCVLLPLVVAWGSLAPVALGQVVLLPSTIKTADVPPVEQVEAFVSGEIDKLRDNSDTTGQSNARESLIGAASGEVSKGFLTIYIFTLNTDLKRVANDPQLRTRLNAAIVACRVAEKTADRVGNGALADVILLFMQDKSEGIALWGIKGAKFIVAAALQDPKIGTQLWKQLAIAVQKHPAGPVVQEAYEVLNLQKNAPPQMLAMATTQMLSLLEARIKQYISGIPPEPGSERIPASFLCDERLWKTGVLTAPVKVQIVQDFSDLISLIGQRAAVASSQDLMRLLEPTLKVGGALYVIGVHVNNPGLQAAATPLTKVTPALTGSAVLQLTKAIYPAIQQVQPFSGVKAPPTIDTGSASSAPTDATAK